MAKQNIFSVFLVQIEKKRRGSNSSIYPCAVLNRFACPYDKKISTNNNEIYDNGSIFSGFIILTSSGYC
jgi:hypothetical protein